MQIKSLLLGSAAALVAVTGVRAADIIMVEPEPVEYVRVCDVYGTGFFYIPGTETCMKIDGHVRFQVNVADDVTNAEGDDYQVGTAVRARINLDVREETEYGTLRGFARIQATNNTGGNAGYAMDQAYIQLGGLTMGWTDSVWKSGIGGINAGLLTDSDLIVGDIKTNQVNYTFATGGFSATLGLEDDGTGDVVPDVHARIAYSGAWGGAFLAAVYDETFNAEDSFSDIGSGLIAGPLAPFLIDDGSNDAFALKAGVELKDLLVAGSSFKVIGHYAFDPTTYAAVSGLTSVAGLAFDNQGTQFNVTPGAIPLFLEWSVGAGYSQRIGAFSVALAGQYGELFETAVFDDVTDTFLGFTDGEYYAIVGNVGYNFTNNFGALAEVSYKNVDFDGLGSVDQTAGFLRFQRNF